MKYIDFTLPTPEHNLAFDEVILDLCEQDPEGEVLRFWESREYLVVVGYSGRVTQEVNLTALQTRNIPILRRTSGGGAVVLGPGCLNYALALRCDARPEVNTVKKANCYVMEQHEQALRAVFGPEVQVEGITDLTIRGRKFSGNSQRRKKRSLLFHGTFLMSLELNMVTTLLLKPRRQPEYRNNRLHEDFLTNLSQPPSVIKEALATAWGADEFLRPAPVDAIDRLVKDKYSHDAWNFKFK